MEPVSTDVRMAAPRNWLVGQMAVVTSEEAGSIGGQDPNPSAQEGKERAVEKRSYHGGYSKESAIQVFTKRRTLQINYRLCFVEKHSSFQQYIAAAIQMGAMSSRTSVQSQSVRIMLTNENKFVRVASVILSRLPST